VKLPNGRHTWGFIYKNLPAFQLKPGDQLAFDETAGGYPLYFNSAIDIEMAATTENGGEVGDVPATPYTLVVPEQPVRDQRKLARLSGAVRSAHASYRTI
jgi:hypothetical protein